jgi:hypothetical protein
VSTPFSLAFSIASATALLDQLDAPDLRRVERQHSAIVPDPAEEVEAPSRARVRPANSGRARRRGSLAISVLVWKKASG